VFLLCPETTYTEGQKDRVIAATERDAIITRAISGKTLRQLKTPLTEAWDTGPLPPLGWPFHSLLTIDIMDWAYSHMDESAYDEILVTPVGQSTRLLNRRRTARQVIDDMIEDAARILEEVLPREVALVS
jgi:NAD(P)H-dependent flavin oxidoreductase YrpB (nitropropane dioxygenase family)